MKSAPLKLVKDFRIDHLPPNALVTNLKNNMEPKDFKEVIKLDGWKLAMQDEYKALTGN